jgi:diketogulonate reductase-like aldo/keto reductase
VIARPFGPAGAPVPVIGQGTWRMGEDAARRRGEVAALRLGIELGMTHIDTAEMYGDGGSERLVAEAIAGQRHRVFLASKVLPENASRTGTVRACEASLRRLRTDHLDLYLLHWWSERHPIEATMEAMAELVGRGLTRFVGVSNLDVGQMRRAQAALGDVPLASNQVLYHLRDRAIEEEVLPHCERKRVAVVGYTPLARGGYMKEPMTAIARRHGRTPRQVALNFLTRRPSLFAIPKASHPEHVRENAGALDFRLTPAEVRAIDGAT